MPSAMTLLPNAVFALARWLQERPTDIAVRAERGDINYGELDRMVADAVATLDSMRKMRSPHGEWSRMDRC